MPTNETKPHLATPCPTPKRSFWRTAVYVTFLSTAIGGLFTYIFKFGGTPFMNWVISMLIGSTTLLFIRALRWVIWKNKKPEKWGFLLIFGIAGTAAYYVGLALGLFLFDVPFAGFYGLIYHNDLTVPVMSFIFSLIIGILFWNQNKIAELVAQTEKEKARTASIEKQALQVQLQLLQAQIEPHMLFNTLANLQALIALDTTKAQHMLEQLIIYLRATLNNSRGQSTTLQKEFSLMRAYLDILSIRMGERLAYTLNLPDELQSTLIAPMLIQPLIENAIKHGLEPKMEGGHIAISAYSSHEQAMPMLHIMIADTGFGLANDYDEQRLATQYFEQKNERQIGNANIKERLLALYGNQARLCLSANQPEGVIAHIAIPLMMEVI